MKKENPVIDAIGGMGKRRKKMSEKWVTLWIDNDKTLICQTCDKYLHNQIVHLYLNADDELEETICEKCFGGVKK